MTALEHLDLNLLLTFRAVVDEGGVYQAAKALHRSQPAISARIRQLQDSLSVRLFVKGGRQLVLTPTGRQVYDRTSELLDQIQTLLDEVRRLEDAASGGTLRIGALPTAGVFLVAPAIARTRAVHPHAKFELEYELVSTLLARLDKAKIDVVIGVGREPLVEHVQILGDVRPVLVTRKASRSGKPNRRSAISTRMIKSMGLISYGRVEDDFFNSVAQFLDRHGLRNQVGVRVSHIETVKTLVAAGAGAAILPDYTVTEPNLEVRRIAGLDFTQKAWIASRASSIAIPSVRRFVDDIQAQFRRRTAESQPKPWPKR